MERFNILYNKTIKLLLVALLCVMLTIITIFVFPPSYADGVDEIPLISTTPTTFYEGTYIISNKSVSGYYLQYFDSANDAPVYVCLVADGDYYSPCFFTLSSNEGKYGTVYYRDAGAYGGWSNYRLPINNTLGDYLYVTLTALHIASANVSTATIPYFDTVSDAISALEASNIFSAERTITIQPGYVAYIETYGGTLDIIAQFPNLSRLSRPLWENSVQIAFGVYAPAPGHSFTFTSNFGSSIDWLIPASAPTNLLGQSKIGGRQYNAGLPDNGSSVAIYNPAYSGLSSNTNDYGRAIKAPTLTVTISNCVFVEWFKLRTDATISVQSGPAIIANSDDNYTSSVIYLPVEGEGDTVVTDADCYYYNGSTNTSSAGVTMNAGGSNYGTDDIVEDANNMLDNFEEKVTSLLSSPIRHITNLVNNATAFFTEIIHFFDWLPDEVRSVIISCLALIPVIGFIKLLF